MTKPRPPEWSSVLMAVFLAAALGYILGHARGVRQWKPLLLECRAILDRDAASDDALIQRLTATPTVQPAATAAPRR